MVLLPSNPLETVFIQTVPSFYSYKPIKHGQTAQKLWQSHGKCVRVLSFKIKSTKQGQFIQNIFKKHGIFGSILYQIFYSIFKQSLTVTNQWREYLVSFSGLRSITCSKCDKEKFYVKIQTTIESEFLSALSNKFVCPKCKGNKKC